MIATEVHGSVSKNCIELNELPNDGKNNNTYGDEIIDWNVWGSKTWALAVGLSTILYQQCVRGEEIIGKPRN